MIENGTLLQDRYLIERKIGTGGMGAVYLAVDKRFDNAVAIKETFYKEDEFGDAFEREARLLNALQHPALPHVSDYFAENDGYFLVMQYIEGEDLSDILKRDGSFPVEDVLAWTDELLDALDYLHSQEPPVIHRDIKPHNLKLTPRGQIMLLDFGLAKVNKKDATEVSVFGYSRTYSPLEQIQGTGTDARSDIFALGASLFHLLTGTPPINALTRASAIVGGSADPLKLANEIRPEVPDAVANVINSALALNAEHRFLTAQAMRQALEYARNEEPVTNAAFVGASPQTIKQAENQNFPALESFSAAKNSFNEKPEAAKITADDSENSSSTPIVVDIPTKVSGVTENNQNRFIWAAAAVLLLFGIAAAFYFTSDGDSPEKINQTTINANQLNVNSNRESAAETKSKNSSDERQTEKSETDETRNQSDAEKSSVSTQQSKQNSPLERQNQTSKNDEAVTEEESLEAEELPEVVIPEKANNKKRPRPEVRPMPDVMTEEEFEQIKREEKQRRREHKNRNKPDNNELN